MKQYRLASDLKGTFLKGTFQALAFFLLCILSQFAYADVVYLYDASGNVSAVIDPQDANTNVYLASTGNPVGYVDNETGAVFSYAGKQIGWYSDGVWWDNNGYILAYAETSQPKTITVPLVKREVVINRPTTPPVIVTDTRDVIPSRPTFVYEVSPTPVTGIVTVEPAM